MTVPNDRNTSVITEKPSRYKDLKTLKMWGMNPLQYVW